MNPVVYLILHLFLILALAGSGLASWRIYFRYLRAHAPETSAWAMMSRLRREGNPDGRRMVILAGISLGAGAGLLVLTWLR